MVEPELEDYYVEEAVKSIKAELDILRMSPMPDQKHVGDLLAWIRFGMKSGKFTYELLGTSPAELIWFSQILITH